MGTAFSPLRTVFSSLNPLVWLGRPPTVGQGRAFSSLAEEPVPLSVKVQGPSAWIGGKERGGASQEDPVGGGRTEGATGGGPSGPQTPPPGGQPLWAHE